MNKLILTTIISLSLFFTSCSEKSSDEVVESMATESQKDTTTNTANEGTKFKFDFTIANIPSPLGSIDEISSWGVDYNSSLLVDSKKRLSATNEFVKALTLGIYNIDMAYAMVNNKSEDVLKYMQTVLSTSEALGLKSAVDHMVGKRAEKNLGSKDSLLKILGEIFVKSDSYLRTNERIYTASSVFAGSWIENLYLACKTTDGAADTKIKEKGYKHLWDQRFYLKNLTDLLDDYKDKQECVNLNNELKKIHAEIDIIKDPKDLNVDNFKSISEKIYGLRASLVN